MSVKLVLKLIAIVGAVLLVGPYVLRTLAWLVAPPIRVSFALPVSGHVSAVSMNRHYYLQQLDGATYQYHDFNEFVPAASTVDRNSLSQDDENQLVLGAHLQKGDYVQKAANSAVLTVTHGTTVSQWRCPTP